MHVKIYETMFLLQAMFRKYVETRACASVSVCVCVCIYVLDMASIYK